MTMFCANHATTAAAADAACCAARTFSHNIALILDAALLASIFVALISLLDILCLSLSLGLLALLSLILRGAAARLKDSSPCLL